MDFVTGIPTLEETELPEVPPRNIGEKIAAFLFWSYVMFYIVVFLNEFPPTQLLIIHNLDV